jgi:hypothetical protein
MTLIGPPLELSQIGDRARAKRDRRRTRRLLTRGRLTEYLDRPCRYCGVLMTDWNGPEDWRAPSRDHWIPRSHGGSNSLANVESIMDKELDAGGVHQRSAPLEEQASAAPLPTAPGASKTTALASSCGIRTPSRSPMLLRGRARASRRRQPDDPRRGAAHGGELRQVAGAVAES